MLIAAGVAGVLFSVIALTLASRFLSDIQDSAEHRIVALDNALVATGVGLVVAH